jgi:hypothetical protein
MGKLHFSGIFQNHIFPLYTKLFGPKTYKTSKIRARKSIFRQKTKKKFIEKTKGGPFSKTQNIDLERVFFSSGG